MPKRTTVEMLELDIRELDAEGYTTPGAAGRWQWRRGEEQIANILVACEEKGRLWLCYTTGGSEDHNYPIRLDWTKPHFGGERPWFLCPAKGCGRRCAILYGPAVFACRECHDLAYPRENISGSRWQVARYRLRKLADKLEAESIGGPMGYPRTPIRPKGMHRETYEDLLHKYREAYQEHRRAITADMLKVIQACGGDVDLSDEEREQLEDEDGT